LNRFVFDDLGPLHSFALKSWKFLPRNPQQTEEGMAKTKSKRRRRATPEQRAKILAMAKQEGLTANDVYKRFGVPVVTYYSWRKKAGATPIPAARGRQRRGVHSSDGELRGVIQDRLRARMPEIMRSEVDRYLDSVLGALKPGRRRRR
jgi:transposase-like protein